MLKLIQKEMEQLKIINRDRHLPLLGIVEQVGELSHSVRKRDHGIETNESPAEIKDAVAGIVIALCDFCNVEDIDLQNTVQKIWSHGACMQLARS